jgi:hypothetical protein
MMPNPAPATVDLDREEALDELADESQEAVREIARAWWLSPEERDESLQEVISALIDAKTDTGALDPVDGTLIRAGVEFIWDQAARVKSALGKAFERSPEKLKRKAARAQKRGKAEKALRLLQEAAEREARRGNG